MRLLGLDPGLRNTGWGIIEVQGNRLSHVADGVVRADPKQQLAARLVEIYDGLADVIARWRPEEAAVEKTFVNKNAVSTLKLGQARGIALLAPSRAGLGVFEYPPNLVKKTVVGTGHAAKEQVQAMIGVLLPGAAEASADAADALAVAVCHAHHRTTEDRVAQAVAQAVSKAEARR